MKTYLLYLLTATCLFFAPMTGLMVAVGAAITLDTALISYKSTSTSGSFNRMSVSFTYTTP